MKIVLIIILIVVGAGIIAFHSHIVRFGQKLKKIINYNSPFLMRLYSYQKFLLIAKILVILVGIGFIVIGVIFCFDVRRVIDMGIAVIVMGVGTIVFHSQISSFSKKLGKSTYYDSRFLMWWYSRPKSLLIEKILLILVGVGSIIVGTIACFDFWK